MEIASSTKYICKIIRLCAQGHEIQKSLQNNSLSSDCTVENAQREADDQNEIHLRIHFRVQKPWSSCFLLAMCSSCG